MVEIGLLIGALAVLSGIELLRLSGGKRVKSRAQEPRG